MSKMVHESRNVSHFTSLNSGCLLGKHESNTPDLKTNPMCTSQSLSVKRRSAASVITPESSEKHTTQKCFVQLVANLYEFVNLIFMFSYDLVTPRFLWDPGTKFDGK